MSNPNPPSVAPFLEVKKIRAAAAQLVQVIREAGREQSLSSDDFETRLESLGETRAAPLAHPLLSGGVGRGASVQLADGRPVIDLVSGIGPYVFGHGDLDLLETATIAAATDVVFQGHVLPGHEYDRLSEKLTQMAGERLEHVWLSLSGSMANENALKLILQRHAPADQIIAFDGAFHGRTLAMAELTDRPEYREGLPQSGRVHRIPFYDSSDPISTERSLEAFDRVLAQAQGGIAAMCFELVQGEGGFNAAPPAFFEALMKRCRDAGIAIWIDEIQTFGRTGELFAFQTLGLEEFVDVVTAGKILQGSATLFTANYRPRPKLIAGTWAGSSVGMAVGHRILERLESGGFFGEAGRTQKLAEDLEQAFIELEVRLARDSADIDTPTQLENAVGPRTGLGAMLAFVPFDGKPSTSQRLIEVCLEEGVLLQTAGRNPLKIRLLPPLNLKREEIALAFDALERAMRRVAVEIDWSA